ncbi:hypothetical protein [Planomonospora venezuelensis]|uniref:CU044_5270 family protein n=1 Tax=Planomonospora venezuelensis TaxID=1999 RepID=A0A841D545_PLAVE|nr:hypothetical protein [Planomonospora venezuelensis]MBB5962576.1 hypothetical protein [Planomonospora venezuelensis]GIM99019.1 hypothetical protein Pve01_06780 [Planomonospora venezuelensis]
MTTDELIAALRPDDILDETYRRRREGDLARALATARSRRVLPRVRPLPLRARLALAGTVAAGLAAAVAVPAVTGTAMPAGPGGGRSAGQAGQAAEVSPGPAATPAVTLDARSLLLAGAERAAAETGAEGRYWFERTRTFEPLESGAVVAHSDESWYDGRDGRGLSNQDVVTAFADPADEAAWKEKGSPPLWPGPQRRDFSRLALKWEIGGRALTMDEVRRLPGDAGELERWLRSAHRNEGGGSFPSFVFAAARYLLSSPASPATRAATLRILAGQPGLTLERGVADPLGRTGVAVAADGGDVRLTVDESGARLLAFEYDGPDEEARGGGRSVHLPFRKGFKVAYESSGWVTAPGVRPREE